MEQPAPTACLEQSSALGEQQGEHRGTLLPLGAEEVQRVSIVVAGDEPSSITPVPAASHELV